MKFSGLCLPRGALCTIALLAAFVSATPGCALQHLVHAGDASAETDAITRDVDGSADAPDALDAPDVVDVADATDVTDVTDALDASDVLGDLEDIAPDTTDVPDAITSDVTPDADASVGTDASD